MLDFITSLIVKVIPSNWYEVKKQCESITKICDTVLQVKWYAWVSVSAIFISLSVAVCFWCIYKIKNK